MILSAQTIKKLCQKPRSEALITPFKERDRHRSGLSYGLSHAGYDVTIGQSVSILPGRYVLASTSEKFNIPPTLVMRVYNKSTWARQGILVANGIAEPGWRGYLTLEISNHGERTIVIEKLMPIAQVMFELLDRATEYPYDGKYQDQPNGPIPALT